jgi:hypothetical protein
VDFSGFEDEWKILVSMGVVKLEESTDDILCAGLDDHEELIILDLLGDTENADSIPFPISREKAADALEAILHRLHLTPILLFPIGRWRKVFEGIGFELTDNLAWQEIDSAATIELNTHDPLRCEPGDLHVVHDVLATILRCGKEHGHGITLAALGKPLLIVIEPPGRLRVELFGETLAIEVRELLEQFKA